MVSDRFGGSARPDPPPVNWSIDADWLDFWLVGLPPTSAVDIFVKGLGLVMDTGYAAKMPLPLAAAAHQLFLAASSMGHGKIDDSAVVEVYESMTGSRVKGGA